MPDVDTEHQTHDETNKLAQDGFKSGVIAPDVYVARMNVSIHP